PHARVALPFDPPEFMAEAGEIRDADKTPFSGCSNIDQSRCAVLGKKRPGLSGIQITGITAQGRLTRHGQLSRLRKLMFAQYSPGPVLAINFDYDAKDPPEGCFCLNLLAAQPVIPLCPTSVTMRLTSGARLST